MSPAPRTALIVMPFASEDGPALGPSLLAAALASRGLPVSLLYLNLRFAARFGLAPYRAVDEIPSLLLGEWLFAAALFERGLPATDSFAAEILGDRDPARVDALAAARRTCTAFVEECAEEIAAGGWEIAAFSTSFQQNTASLALARRLKALRPGLRIVFGGANCAGEMGRALIELFPFIDAVVDGEAEETFPRLVEAYAAGDDGGGLVGVRTRPAPDAGPVRVADLDTLPHPDFRDYFDQLRSSGLDLPPRATHLRLETSRGCWWGEKAHCTFCGLSGASLAFRRKSTGRILEDLAALDALPSRSILVVDNCLPREAGWLDAVPELSRRFKFFAEVKPPVTRAEIRRLAAAGIRRIQPGIESLSPAALRRMRKGVKAVENVALLKYAAEEGVALTWNFLCGIPGENAAELESMIRLLPLLHHLPPPVGLFPVQVHRFSPYHDDPEAWGFAGVRPLAAYRHIYPFDAAALARLAYVFEADRPAADAALGRLAAAVTAWRAAALSGRCACVMLDDGTTLEVVDRRGHEEERWTLTGSERALLLAAREPRYARDLCASSGVHDDDDLRDGLRMLIGLKLVYRLDDRYIALPTEAASEERGDAGAAADAAAALLPVLAREGG